MLVAWLLVAQQILILPHCPLGSLAPTASYIASTVPGIFATTFRDGHIYLSVVNSPSFPAQKPTRTRKLAIQKLNPYTAAFG